MRTTYLLPDQTIKVPVRRSSKRRLKGCSEFDANHENILVVPLLMPVRPVKTPGVSWVPSGAVCSSRARLLFAWSAMTSSGVIDVSS